MKSTLSLISKFATGFYIFSAMTNAEAAPRYPVSYYSASLQTDSTKKLELANTFQSAMTTIANRWHVTVVVESEPCKAVLEKADGATIEKRLSTATQEELEATLEMVASSYDYTAQRQGDCFILRKKYSHPEDIPAVTLAECRQSLAEMDRIISKFSPNISLTPVNGRNGQDVLYTDLLKTLTPLQLQQMGKAYSGNSVSTNVSPDKVLRVTDMNPAQQQLVWRLATFQYVQRPQQAVQSSLSEINIITKSGAVFVQKHLNGTSLFGYEMRNGLSDDTSKFISFWKINSTPYKSQTVWVDGRRLPPLIVLRQSSNTSDAELSKFAKPVSSSLLSALPSSPKQRDESGTTRLTLGSITHALNERDTKTRFVVDEALTDKPATLFGKENADSEALFRALATLYGLKVFHLPDQPLRMARESIPRLTSISELKPAVLNLYPAPLRRAFGIEITDPERIKREAEEDARQDARLNGPDYFITPSTEEDRALRAKLEDKKRFFMQQAALMSAEMGKYLKAVIVPHMETVPEGMIRAADLSSDEQSAFATYLMATACIDYSYRAGRTVPDYITSFGQVCLSGNISKQPDGTRDFGVFLSTLDSKTGRTAVAFNGSARVPNELHVQEKPE